MVGLPELAVAIPKLLTQRAVLTLVPATAVSVGLSAQVAEAARYPVAGGLLLARGPTTAAVHCARFAAQWCFVVVYSTHL